LIFYFLSLCFRFLRGFLEGFGFFMESSCYKGFSSTTLGFRCLAEFLDLG
jgi:hypothetical protein